MQGDETGVVEKNEVMEASLYHTVIIVIFIVIIISSFHV
jgi:hypothetical protein